MLERDERPAAALRTLAGSATGADLGSDAAYQGAPFRRAKECRVGPDGQLRWLAVRSRARLDSGLGQCGLIVVGPENGRFDTVPRTRRGGPERGGGTPAVFDHVSESHRLSRSLTGGLGRTLR